MLHRTFSFAIAALLAASPVASATSIDGIDGQVLVNTGGGFARTTKASDVKPGDRIMARPGGSALISYGDGCTVPVREGSVYVVKQKSPCPANDQSTAKVEAKTTVTEAASSQPPGEPVGEPAPADSPSAAVVTAASAAGGLAAGGITEGALLTGAVVVGAGAAAAVVLSSKNGKPASP